MLLVSNPGSSSRKYSVYSVTTNNLDCIAHIHFETNEKNEIVYSLTVKNQLKVSQNRTGISHIAFALTKLVSILIEHDIIGDAGDVQKIGLRLVAPSTFFQRHHVINTSVVSELKKIEHRSSLHISTVLQEVALLEKEFPSVQLVGVSDSAFHATMPSYARTYGISQTDAKHADVWRFGYHGLSMSSVVRQLTNNGKLPNKVIACHLGSGSSITALLSGKSIDTTMGYSPTEGLVMATRSGSIDFAACNDLISELSLTKNQLENYLSHQSGLLGLSGKTSDIRKLLELEAEGHQQAKLALAVFVYRVQTAIGQMVAATQGCDALIFTGTVGERSQVIRTRIIDKLDYLGINHGQDSKPVIILSTDEEFEIASAVMNIE